MRDRQPSAIVTRLSLLQALWHETMMRDRQPSAIVTRLSLLQALWHETMMRDRQPSAIEWTDCRCYRHCGMRL